MSDPDFTERIVRLEMTISHLQHELEQMHSVLLALQTDLKVSREHVSKLERRMIHAIEVREERDPTDERPPHY